GRLLAVPDRAAAADARVGLHRHRVAAGHERKGLERQHTGRRLLQYLRRGPLDAHLLRADHRCLDVPPGEAALGQDRVAAVPGAGDVRGRGDRQPLLHRRVPGRAHRRSRGADRQAPAGQGQTGGVGVRPGARVAMAEQTTTRARLPGRPGRQRRVREGPSTQELMRNKLIESRLTPNAISMTGFALNLAAAGLVVGRQFFLAGVAFIVGSIMDTLDGRYSRMSGKGTPFGAFLDSTLDRLEEGIVLTAAGAYFASRHDEVAVAAVVVAVLGSLMVSYTRARAEALGVECKVGLATRPVRVVILSIGLVFATGASIGNLALLAPAIYAMAILTTFTVFQRVLHVRRALNRSERAIVPPAA